MEVKKLKECCTIIAGQSPESKYYNSNGDGLPFFQGKADFGELYPSIRVYCSQPTKIAEKDDILLSVRAPVGPTNLAPCKVCIGRGLTAIRPSEVLLTRYVLLFFRYFEAQLASKGTGTTFKAITQDVVKNLEIPIPPLPEQERIVARIEELFSQLDAGVETLKKTKAEIVLYRQAVFSSVIGKYDGVSKKLSDIAVTVDGDRGKNYPKKAELTQTGDCLFLTAANVKPYGWSFEDNTFISKEKDGILHGGRLQKNDVVITTRGTLGNVAIYDESVPFDTVRINSCMLIMRVTDESVSPYYLAQYLMSPMFKYQIAKLKSGTAQPQIPANILREIPLKIPSSNDQNAIIGELTGKFSVCDSIEQTVDTALQQAEAMRQSILKNAFEGKLT